MMRPASALWAVCLLVLGGCTSSSHTTLSMADMNIVAKDQRFALVRLQPGQDLADLATVFLGDRQNAWQLSELNPGSSTKPGEIVAVPLVPVNPGSVYTDGYRTLPMLCYHQFTRNKNIEHRLELRAHDFEKQIRYLLDNHYQLLSFAEVGEIMAAGRAIPPKAVVITIDDGYGSVYDVAWPILKKYQAKATLFVYTDFIGAGKALTWSEMQEMAASGLIEIQSHGKSHSSLSKLPDDQSESSYVARLQRELAGSEAEFTKRMGSPPVFLSYPYGNSSVTAARLLKTGGYQLAATVTRGDNTSFSDPYLLHRSMIYGDKDLNHFVRGLRTFRRKPLQ